MYLFLVFCTSIIKFKCLFKPSKKWLAHIRWMILDQSDYYSYYYFIDFIYCATKPLCLCAYHPKYE